MECRYRDTLATCMPDLSSQLRTAATAASVGSYRDRNWAGVRKCRYLGLPGVVVASTADSSAATPPRGARVTRTDTCPSAGNGRSACCDAHAGVLSRSVTILSAPVADAAPAVKTAPRTVAVVRNALPDGLARGGSSSQPGEYRLQVPLGRPARAGGCGDRRSVGYSYRAQGRVDSRGRRDGGCGDDCSRRRSAAAPA